ncbi:MAG: RNA ligase family protein [Lachnospiraceae bacterium]|nr:RNA ligase family protein [Lachnospiraceae bacterium]
MFYKFPSTPYIFLDKSIQKKEKNCLTDSEVKAFLNNKVTVEEKIDGANLGISFDHNGNLFLQNRGEFLCEPYSGQWKPLKQWINLHVDELFDILDDKYILYGEWCYACHSVKYDRLPDWFLAFDLYDKQNQRFLSVHKRDMRIKTTTLNIVPSLGYGLWAKEELPNLFSISKVGNSNSEGIYLRLDNSDWLLKRAKMVRPEFRQQIEEHWSRKPLEKNWLIMESELMIKM